MREKAFRVRDELTGLLSQPEFLRELALLMPDRHRHVLAYIDLEDFRAFNVEHSFTVGDRVLAEVAQLVDRVVGGRGLVARVGGDEFAFVLRDHSVGEGRALAAQVLRAIHEHRSAALNRELRITARCGLVPGNAFAGLADAREWFSMAREACYVARETDGLYALGADSTVAQEKGSALAQLLEALSEQRFDLVLQPCRSAAGTEARGGPEVSLRFHDRDGCEMDASQLRAVAASSRVEAYIDRVIVREALAMLRGRRVSLPPDARLALALSRSSVVEPGFHEPLLTCLQQSPVEARRMCMVMSTNVAAFEEPIAAALRSALASLGVAAVEG